MGSEVDPPAFTPGFYNPSQAQTRQLTLPSYASVTADISYDIWDRFFTVAEASEIVADAKKRLALLDLELEKKSKELKKYKENTTKLFKDLHRGRSALEVIQRPLNVLRRIPSQGSQADEKGAKQREDFEASHRVESQLQEEVSVLEEQKHELQYKIDMNVSLASEMDQVFELVAGRAAASLQNDDNDIKSAEEDLARRSNSYSTAEESVSNFHRARVTVQHAHHYYTDVLQILDAIRGTALGRAALGGVSEISKNRDYQDASVIAGKAQICFNETIRVITPHIARIPPDVLPDFEKVKELGLLQATKIYGLMYGWQQKVDGVSELWINDMVASLKLMLQKQETAYGCLSRFAVWVQDEVPVIESEVHDSRLQKVAAQKKLVGLWKENCRMQVS
ncbi:hypothetical protein Clacol_004884 [Clathrus columnatus]|uniref:Uncharacterized protein n=1 Tax=Clathrus columnatus TaxID=1419009 RepID=A0AAV5AAD2_9AGAM|nr:hypothetical protein Clacol_004884 [Clathrus columnatus]